MIQSRVITTTTIPPTDDIVLSGLWFSYNVPYGINGPVIPCLATFSKGASISFSLTHTVAFYINGHVNFDHGPYHVTITPPPEFGSAESHNNGSSQWVGLNMVKYIVTGLDRTETYQVVVTNDSGLYYDMSQIVVFDAIPSVTYTLYCPVTNGFNPGLHHRHQLALRLTQRAHTLLEQALLQE
jgi:hypothetical protein